MTELDPALERLSHYDYELPEELIASRPMERRSDARLLVVHRDTGELEHLHVRDLPRFLTPRDCMVLNNTRVVPARLKGVRTLTGGGWEGLFLEPADAGDIDPGDVHFQKYDAALPRWHILSTTRGKLQPGETVTLHDPYARPYCRLLMEKKAGSDGSWFCIPTQDGDPMGATCWEILDAVGSVPIPPYIRKGVSDASDVENYQTVYASERGAVAAPTAGLHFTPQLLDEIRDRGVAELFVTLHVGLGTFRPISCEQLRHHHMHREWGNLTRDVADHLRQCRAAGGRILAVGTTSVRVLESARELEPFCGFTDLFIRPPYQFRNVDLLLTNFHLPMSSLLVLVRTFGGDALLQKAYAAAIAHRYRFYSYGDAMLIV